MKLLSFKIDTYKAIRKQKIEFPNEEGFPFGCQIVGIIGKNGTGKTTICSAIANLIQGAFTLSTSKIKCDCEIEYMLRDNRVKISFQRSKYFIYKNDELVFASNKENSRADREKVSALASSIFPGNLILSTFSINGEYPSEKQSTYIGFDPVKKFDVSSLYGDNHYNFPSFTNGIVRFILDDGKKEIGKYIFNEMNLKYTGNLLVKITSTVLGAIKGTFKNEHDSNFNILNWIRSNLPGKDLALGDIVVDEEFVTKLNSEFPLALGKVIYVNGLEFKKANKLINTNQISSGEKFLILRYLSILSSIKRHSLVIIEEPEVHLNPSWRELFIPAIHKMISAYESASIFTTHDYRSIRFLQSSNVFLLKNGVIRTPKESTLLCDEFDFEGMNGGVNNWILAEVDRHIQSLSLEKRKKFLDKIAYVPEKIQLKKKYIDAKN